MSCKVCGAPITKQPQGSLHAFSTFYACGAEIITVISTGEQIETQACGTKRPTLSIHERDRAVFLAITAVDKVAHHNGVAILDTDYECLKIAIHKILINYTRKLNV